MAADPTHKMAPTAEWWLHHLGDRGKMVSPLFHKVVLPTWPCDLGNKEKMTDKKSPCRKAGAYGAVLAADEDLSPCLWHFLLPPVGMALVLVLMSSLLQVCVRVGGRRVCWHPYGVAQPQRPAQALVLVGFAKFVLKPVCNFETQLFQVAAVASPESHPKQSLHLWQVLPGGRAGWLGCSNLFKLRAPPDCRTIPVLAGPGLKKNSDRFWAQADMEYSSILSYLEQVILIFFSDCIVFLHNRLVCYKMLLIW